MSGISEQTWEYEKHLAVESLDTTGHLPEGTQPGAKFWNMVREHYLQDVKTTGNDHRFLRNHCPFVDHYVPLEFTPPIASPIPPSQLPTLPVVSVPSPPPVNPPSSPPPSHTGNPGPPVGVVPEPPGFVLGIVSLLVCLIGAKSVSRRK